MASCKSLAAPGLTNQHHDDGFDACDAFATGSGLPVAAAVAAAVADAVAAAVAAVLQHASNKAD